jgi:hypothetical protein
VYVKSPLKVLIYTAPRSKDSGKDIRNRIESYMAQYTRHLAGEQYLFVEFGAGNDHRCYLYVVPNDGTVSLVSLSPIHWRQPLQSNTLVVRSPPSLEISRKVGNEVSSRPRSKKANSRDFVQARGPYRPAESAFLGSP